MRRETWAAAVAGLVLGFVVNACAPTEPCTPDNCTGCCDEADFCHPGNEVAACGKSGSACVSCAPSVCGPEGRCYEMNELLDAGLWDGTLVFPDDDGGYPDAGDVDAGDDAGVDAGGDAGVDAGTDAGVDAGTDAGTPDAGVDAGQPDAGNLPSIRFANFYPVALDFCVWTGNTPPALSAFYPSGIPPGTVSAWVPFAGLAINYKFLIVPAGVGCVTDAGFTASNQPGNSVKFRTQWASNTGSIRGGGLYESPTVDPSADTVFFLRTGDSSATETFVPDPDDGGYDAGGRINLTTPAKTLLPDGVPGVLQGSVPGIGNPPDRPFKGQAGGFITVIITGTETLVCDNQAPVIGNQSDCRPSVRAP